MDWQRLPLCQNPWRICAFKLPLSAAPGLLVGTRALPSRLISTSIILVPGTNLLHSYSDVDPAKPPKVTILFSAGRTRIQPMCASMLPVGSATVRAPQPAQHLNGSRPGKTRQAPIRQGGREQVRAVLRRVFSRIAMLLEVEPRKKLSPGCAFDRTGDMDAAGPIVAACASVESLSAADVPRGLPG
ncbi:hypothetical protein HDV57DRAFT_125045 [Trichoderma longibrachiatum]